MCQEVVTVSSKPFC